MSPSEKPVFSSKGASTNVLPLSLDQYAITSNGFLPAEPPLRKLPNPYYGPWESLVESLPVFLANKTLRDQARKLPVLSAEYLVTEPEWRRACVVLGFLAHAYIWGGETASEVRSPSLHHLRYTYTNSVFTTGPATSDNPSPYSCHRPPRHTPRGSLCLPQPLEFRGY